MQMELYELLNNAEDDSIESYINIVVDYLYETDWAARAQEVAKRVIPQRQMKASADLKSFDKLSDANPQSVIKKGYNKALASKNRVLHAQDVVKHGVGYQPGKLKTMARKLL